MTRTAFHPPSLVPVGPGSGRQLAGTESMQITVHAVLLPEHQGSRLAREQRFILPAGQLCCIHEWKDEGVPLSCGRAVAPNKGGVQRNWPTVLPTAALVLPGLSPLVGEFSPLSARSWPRGRCHLPSWCCPVGISHSSSESWAAEHGLRAVTAFSSSPHLTHGGLAQLDGNL